MSWSVVSDRNGEFGEWLVKHDSELLDKVSEKLKADIEKYWYRSELDMGADNVNCLIDEVIAEMKLAHIISEEK